MPIFDPEKQRVCVRIVYDGAGSTGKTTNLAALCKLLVTQHTSELYSPGELAGRTLYFDWVQVLAGVLCGFPAMVQIISVPGQTVLTPRRRHLLSTADAIVLVCDSSPAGVERAREGLRLIDEMSSGRPIPLVVQANKQDQINAIVGAECLRRLGREDAEVVEAIATEGIGVIDTFVTAFRAISRALQAESERADLRLPIAPAPVARDLLARLEGEAIDPEWAAELLLEEAQASFLLDGSWGDLLRDPEAAGSPPVAASFVSSRPSFVQLVKLAAPVIPGPDVETGFIWPAHTGRQLLESLAPLVTSPEADLREVDGGSSVVCTLGNYVLRTSRAERFEDREEARQALVRAARERTKLGALLAPETVLVVQSARDGALWLWTVHATIATVPAAYERREDKCDELRRMYTIALVDALRVALTHGFALHLAPEHFGISENGLSYIGPVGGDVDQHTLSAELVEALDGVKRMGWEMHAFLESFEQELRLRLSKEEVTRAHSLTSLGRHSSAASGTVSE